jgi:subtilisin family serine protease
VAIARNTVAVAAAATLGVLGVALGQRPAGASLHQSASVSQAQKVIVVLRDQLSATPATRAGMSTRTVRASAAQNSVLTRLAGPSATHVRHFALANAFAATVTTDQVAALQHDPSVAEVVKDASVPMPSPSPDRASGASTSGGQVQPAADGPDAICPTDPAQPLLEPEALQSIHALTTDGSPNAQELSTGSGVTVAYIADGIDPDNPDFIRPDSSHVIIDYQDFSGDGPSAPSGGAEAFGDASSIAAQGTVSHDLSNFVNPAYPLPAGCNIRIVGVAPDANIVALKAGGEFLTNSAILQSIDYAVRVAHVDVINESFGLSEFPDESNRNAIELFNDQAVAAGVTVTQSTGDGGINGTIGSDAPDPQVISVGATTNGRLYMQTGYAGARAFSNGRWVSDNISALSSAGTTQSGRTQDLVAPGEGNWAVCEPGFLSCVNFGSPSEPSDIQSFGGTSESAPLTAGVAALVISAYRSTHGGASPTPAVIKQIITGTATDLDLPPAEQGTGLLNARAATEAALTWPGATGEPSLASNIVTSTDQVTVTGTPNSTRGATVQVTNVGDSALTVAAGTRGFTRITQSAQATAFDSNTLPTFPYPTTGAPWAFKQLHFSVASDAQRLLVRMAWAGTRPTDDAVMRLSLLAPDGTYVANSRPQGGALSPNYATVDVRHPAAGTWTAVMYSPAGSAGYAGVVGLSAESFRAVAVGSVSPAVFTLAPGASSDVHLAFTLPSTASGDESYALTLGTSEGRHTAVSAIVRTVIDTSSGVGTFAGHVTGGNGRPATPGETFSYEFQVPADQHDLNVSLVFPFSPNSVVDLVLIDPNGEVADVVSNQTIKASKQAYYLTRKIQSFISGAKSGRWHLVVVVQNPVSGTAFDEPFKGQVSFVPVPVDRGALPSSTADELTSGSPETFVLAVTNPGVQPIYVGTDARLHRTVTLQPVPIQGSSTITLPANPAQEPIYNIPPNTSSLTVAAVSSTPAQLELQGSAAGIDVLGDLADAQSGNLVSAASVGEAGGLDTITKGAWFTNMQQIGPFTDAGAPPGQTAFTASMRTLAFDNAVKSSTRDPYLNSVDPNVNGFGRPVRIAPGATANIAVTITPTAPINTNVSGVLNLVTVPNLAAGVNGLPVVTTGEVIARVQYAYRVTG